AGRLDVLRGHQHDPPAAWGQRKVRMGLAQQPGDGGHVDVERAVPGVVVVVGERLALGEDPGCGDDDVDAAEVADGGVDGGAQHRRVADVADDAAPTVRYG